MAWIDWIAEMARQKGRQDSRGAYKSYWKWLSEYYVQVINDMVVLSQLEEPSLRAKMCR